MNKLYGVLFKDNTKIYSFKSEENFSINDNVIVDTEKGLQYGKVVNIKDIDKSDYKEIVRLANDEDTETYYKNLKDSDSALKKAKELAASYNPDMHVIYASFNFDKSQLLITFSADDRVDFRELAKKLASIYRTRIELRQIGARDKARQVGGVGICGQKLCCSNFLNQIDSISMNKAKNQNLSLNPNKINGICGRLLCCLCYEDEEYARCSKGLFPVGSKINYKGDELTIISVDILSRKYKALLKEEKVEISHEELINDSKK